MPYSKSEMKAINGFKPKPPKKWMIKVKPYFKRQYPRFSDKRLNKVIAGKWHKFKPSTRKAIIRKYYGGLKHKSGSYFNFKRRKYEE